MGGFSGSGGIDAMMGSGDRSWIMGGAWQTMTRQDWQGVQQRLFGTSASATGHGGWSPLAIITVTVGGILLVAVAVFVIVRHQFRPPPRAATSPH